MTERDMMAMLAGEIVKRGAWPQCPLVAIGERTGIPASWPGDAVLRAGDLVRFDVGCRYKGYCASVGRTAVLGEPSARQRALYDAVQAGLDAAIGAIGPAVPAGRVVQVAAEAHRAHGLPDRGADHVGHGVGLASREAPLLALDSTSTLEPGEILAVEIAHCEFGSIGVSVKDTVLVTTGGARPLNRSRHGLVVLD
jgi:Xaa-Pro dipeptidase